MIFDTHCHYNLEPLYSDWQRHWQKAQSHGVTQAIVVGTDLHSSRVATIIAEKEPDLFAAVGIHPDEYNSPSDEDIDTDEKKLHSIIGKKIVAIGETGLDYFRLTPTSAIDQTMIETAKTAQQQALRMHFRLAAEHNLPVILHARDRETPEEQTEGNAYWDILTVMQKFLAEEKNKLPGFVMHCLSGPKNYVKAMLKLGAHAGIAANVTYPNAHHLRELVQLVPPDRLLVETDAPFLPPQAYRGQTCEPWMIAETSAFINKTYELNEDLLLKNAKVLFKIK